MPKSKRVEKTTTGLRKVTLTIEADEATLQRLSTLLLFANYPTKEAKYREERMPFDDPETPAELEPLAEDPELARAEITRLLTLEAERMGVEWVRRHLSEHGVTRISELTDEQLPDVLREIQHSTRYLRKEPPVK